VAATSPSYPTPEHWANSDDPTYFGGYIEDNYRLVERHLGIGEEQLVKLAANSFRAAFLGAEQQDRYLEELERSAGLRWIAEAAP
jgi:adenosine deaminase